MSKTLKKSTGQKLSAGYRHIFSFNVSHRYVNAKTIDKIADMFLFLSIACNFLLSRFVFCYTNSIVSLMMTGSGILFG
jgi:hypothetical protein